MPAVIINLLRMLFVAIMQTGAWLVVANVLEKFVDYIRDTLKGDGKLSDTETDDVMLNTTLDALALTAVTVASLKTRIPIRLADKLGLKVGRTQRTTTSPTTTKVLNDSNIKAQLVGTKLRLFLSTLVLSFAGSLPWLPQLIQGFGDQATFGAKNANNFYESIFGTRPFPEANPLDSPGPFSPSEFTDYARGLETAGISGLEYPRGSFLYSQEQLAKLVDYVAGIEAGKGKTVTAKSIIPLVAPFLIMNNKTTTTTSTPVKTTTSSTQLATPKVQVFTGVLSQGVLGKGLEFQTRPDDLIENAQEMLDAASNNLAPFIASLASRITYQVKVVSSITTKDGFTQKGSVTQILTGYDTKGVAKYKTVINKFAVLDIYILNDKNSRIKITTIVLGPVDSVKFQVGQGTITAIETGLQKVASTSNINDIKGISTSAPLTVLTPGINTVTTPKTQWHFVIGRYGTSEIWNSELLANPQAGGREVSYAEWNANPQKSINSSLAGVTEFLASAQRTAQPVVTPSAPVSSPNSGSSAPSTPVVSAPVVQQPVAQPTPTPVVKKGANASNLSEWYSANGQALPNISSRATLYQQYGLGQASYYTGTAEQNTNLLNKLKSM